jgi:type I restriction enzyme S subunit
MTQLVAPGDEVQSRGSKRAEEIIGRSIEARKFIKNFEELVSVAGSTKHLKELVLQLGVRGQLCPDRGESADALVADLRQRCSRLAKEAGRVGDDLAPVPADQTPYSVPSGWRWIRIRDLGGFLGGGTPSKANTAFWTGTIPWVSPKDMKRPYIDDAEDHISKAAIEGSAVKLIPSPSLLYVVRGMILAHSFPVALTTRNVTINQDMKALALAMPELAEFVLRSMQAARERVLAMVERSSHGTCRLDSERVELLPLALPPLSEQKRIVTRVDELMRLIDELEAKQTKKREVQTRFRTAALDALTKAEGSEELASAWRRMAENFGVLFERVESVTSLRAQLLELAMRGTMTKAVRGDDGIEDLVVRLAADTGTMGKLGPVAEAPFRIPDTWRWVRWGHLTRSTSSGWSPQCEGRPRTDGEWGVLKVSAVSWYVFKPEENKALPNGVKPRPEFAARSGDFLMSRANTSELVGRSVIVGKVPERLLLSDKLVRIEFSPLIEQGFVNLYNRTATPRSHYLKNASGTSASMKNISREVILSMPVPLPPLAEQKRIVAKVEALMKLCDDLESKLKAKEETAGKLVDAVVKELVA